MALLIRNREAALLFATLLLNMVGFGVVFPLLPLLVRDMGGSSLALGFMVTAWAAAQFAFSPVWGALSDRWGRRPALVLGVAGMGLTFILMAWAPSVAWLAAARLLGGIVSAATLPAAQAYLADVTAPHERGEAMTTVGAAFGIGFILGPALGAVLAPIGVRGTFVVGAAISGLNLLAVLAGLPEPHERNPDAGARSGRLRVGWREAWREPWAVYMYVVLLMAFSASSLFSMLGLYLLDRLSLDPARIGLAFVVQGAVSVTLQLFVVASAMRRLGYDPTLVLACGLGSAGFGVLAASHTVASAFAGVALVAAGVSLVRPTAAAAVSLRAGLPQGAVMGAQTALDALGRALGPLWAGLAYRWHPSLPFVSSAVIYALAGIMVGACRQAARHDRIRCEAVEREQEGGQARR